MEIAVDIMAQYIDKRAKLMNEKPTSAAGKIELV